MKIRIASIDIFRALTMLLMIYVNDLWTLNNIPSWLEHTEAQEDGMGLADVVFPAFLFIVGLSIPFAIRARINSGESHLRILLHIIRRSLALIIMGFFMVNQDNLLPGLGQLFTSLWQIFMILAFVLIWNHYEQKKFLGIPVWVLQFAGIIILFMLVWTYQGGSPEVPQGMQPHWWGILGLIGWAYLLCSVLYLTGMKQPWTIVIFCLALYMINLFEFLPATKRLPNPLLIVSASNHTLVMSGVLATQIYLMVRGKSEGKPYPLFLLLPAAVLMIYGISVRPLWGISKIMATPSWTAICAAISFLGFALVFTIADILKFTRWAGVIMPAGTNTLTCYLLPGLIYPVLWPLQQLMPASWLSGNIGLLKSAIFALFIIVLTGWLEKIKIRLKI